MRWLVEVSSLGKTDTQRFCVDAESWQRALQSARSQRGEDGPMSGFSIELLEEGYRAVDPLARVRFVVKRAPDDMALTAVLDRPSAAPKAGSPAMVTIAAGSGSSTDQTVKNLPATPSSSSASVNGKKSPSIPAPRPGASQPPPAPTATATAAGGGGGGEQRKKGQTMSFGSGEVAVAEPAIERAAPPAIGSSIPGLPAVKLLTSREQNPNDASPLTYREYAFAVPEGTSEEGAADVLRAQLRYVEAHIATAKMGKLVNLACFDVEFTGKPPRAPLATLTWKDWKGDPVLAYPRRGGGASKPPRPPSQMPPSLEARSVAGAPPVVVAPAAPVPREAAAQGAFPLTQTQPMGEGASAQVAAAHAQAEAQQQQRAAEQQAAAEAEVARRTAEAAAEAQKQAVLQAAAAQQQQQVAAQAAQQQAAQQQPQFPVPAAQALAPTAPPGPTFTEAEHRTSPSQPPGGMVKTPSGRFVRGRVSGDELITSLFESMHDLHFLRDALDGGQFCLALATEVLPARAALIHFFDIEKREWVVACTRGKETQRLLTMRSPDGDEILREAARKRRALVVPNASNASADRYRQIGGGRSLIVAPIMQAGRALGALEIINRSTGCRSPRTKATR